MEGFSRSLKFRKDEEVAKNLKLYSLDDMRVFYGFFGPEDARNVLCQVCMQILLSCMIDEILIILTPGTRPF